MDKKLGKETPDYLDLFPEKNLKSSLIFYSSVVLNILTKS